MMISSMTGFGQGAVERDGRELTLELKSVNHRYLDISYRMPRHLGFMEEALRSLLSQTLSRGHVDVFVSYRNTRQDARKIELDMDLLSAYLSAAKQASQRFSLRDDLGLCAALRLPDVISVIAGDEDKDALLDIAFEAAKLALQELKGMRAQEGERLCKDLESRVDLIRDIAGKIASRAPDVVLEYQQKLGERIEKLLQGVEIDPSRLAAEVAVFADKSSIDEEIVRLGSHIAQMKLLLYGDEAAGRKLDFIVQEMNRELNTIGSKANDAEIANLVILGKAEVEKIREQVQNIE